MEDERKINWLGLFIKILIVFVFIIIVIWLVSKIVNNNKLSDTFKDNINNMEDVAISYFKEIELPQEKGKSIKVTLEELIEKELIVLVDDNKNNSCDVKKSYSKITRNKKDYKVETTLKCGKEEDTITRTFSFKDCKNCNGTKTNTEGANKSNNSQNTSTNTNTNTTTTKTTYYEYVKEETTYTNWVKGEKTGNNIENKYEYYGVEEETYYTLGIINKNDKNTSYKIKLDKVPNKNYYFTKIKSVEYLANDEKKYLSQDKASIEKTIKNMPSSIKKYSLGENDFNYKLAVYYKKGDFYVDAKLQDINTSKPSYNNVYFVPLKITVTFSSPKVTSEKPNGNYETISYYRYVTTKKDVKWSTEASLDGYKRTGNTKEE